MILTNICLDLLIKFFIDLLGFGIPLFTNEDTNILNGDSDTATAVVVVGVNQIEPSVINQDCGTTLPSASQLESIDHIRSKFPATWVWKSVPVG